MNWFESTVTWTEKHHLTSSCSSLSSSPGEPARGGGGRILSASRTRYNFLWQHLKWLIFRLVQSVEGGGGAGGGWCNRAEITVLTSQSVRVSEDETSDRLRRCRRCQKHQKKKTHTEVQTLTHTYLLCRVLNLLILEVLQDYLSHNAAVTSLYLGIWLNVFRSDQILFENTLLYGLFYVA